MVTGAWLPDPTRADRLRYWDGLRWTEHVSESGAVQADPIVGAPPPPPAPPAAPTVPAVAAASPAAGTPGARSGPARHRRRVPAHDPRPGRLRRGGRSAAS